MTMQRFWQVSTLGLVVAVNFVKCQGDPEALTHLNRNQPTKSWNQWQPKPTYRFNELPDQYMGSNRIPGGGEPQTGYNTCANNKWNQGSMCQTAWINSVDDFCLFAPAQVGLVGNEERRSVAYCTKPSHGTRLFPDGTLRSVHFVKTPDYIQVTGSADFTSINIPLGDTGGEYDPHGADDLGNPIGSVVFTTAVDDGKPLMISEWTNFMSQTEYCLRACFGNNAAQHCEHRLDVMGCHFNIPANYSDGFESCDGDNAEFQMIYNGFTFQQGDAVTPPPHPAPSSSNCQAKPSVGNGIYAVRDGKNVVIGSVALPASTGTEKTSTTIATATRVPTMSTATTIRSSTSTQTKSGSNSSSNPSFFFLSPVISVSVILLVSLVLFL